MKKIILLFSVLVIALSGCGQKKISEAEFGLVWHEYLKREFAESFDEKQSISQRTKILDELLKENGFIPEEFKIYMKKNHPDKYRQVCNE